MRSLRSIHPWLLTLVLTVSLAPTVQAQKGVKVENLPNFDLRRFHDDFLGHGLLPFGVLRQVMLGDGHDGVVLA